MTEIEGLGVRISRCRADASDFEKNVHPEAYNARCALGPIVASRSQLWPPQREASSQTRKQQDRWVGDAGCGSTYSSGTGSLFSAGLLLPGEAVQVPPLYREQTYGGVQVRSSTTGSSESEINHAK